MADTVSFLAEQSGELVNAITFLLFGAVLLGPALGELDWRVIGHAVGSLTVVRMLPVAPAMLGVGMRLVTVGFLGWFGPRGLASIVFVLLVEQTQLPERPLMLAVVTWTVALSVYAHGLTAWPGAKPLGRLVRAHATDHLAMPKSAPLAERRLRAPNSIGSDRAPTSGYPICIGRYPIIQGSSGALRLRLSQAVWGEHSSPWANPDHRLDA